MKERILAVLGFSILIIAVLLALFLPASCPRSPPVGPGHLQCPTKDNHIVLRVLIGVVGVLVAYGLIASALVLSKDRRGEQRFRRPR
jgi:hypothetical protein